MAISSTNIDDKRRAHGSFPRKIELSDLHLFSDCQRAPPWPLGKTCSTSRFVSRTIRYTRFCQLIGNMSRQSAVFDNGLVKKLRRKMRCVFVFAKLILFFIYSSSFFLHFLYRKDLIYFLFSIFYKISFLHKLFSYVFLWLRKL